MRTSLLLAIPFLIAFTLSAFADPPLLPKDWVRVEELQQVEQPLQKQLDTGVGMLATAWNMAILKDAELFVVYVRLAERLSAKERAGLLKEQEAWLKQREKAAAKADDGQSGQIGHLQSASEHQAWSEKRILELQKRLAKR
jgi:uncharacterized protein YecT (DUF1311 family)